jgi:hypothetical protein
MPDELSPMSILREAIKAVPEVKWALGVGGILAGVSLVPVLRVDPLVAVVGIIATLAFMSILVLFARASALGTSVIAVPAIIFTWFTLVLFMGWATGLSTSIFFNTPLPLQRWLTGEQKGIVQIDRGRPPKRQGEPTGQNYEKYVGVYESREIYTASRDTSRHITWDNGSGNSDPTGATSGQDGVHNSAILARSSTNLMTHMAASACRDLKIGEHIDWYLPSIDELYFLWQHKSEIGGFDDSGLPYSTYYWSSTEKTNLLAYAVRFSDGYKTEYGKGNQLSLRCIRASPE